MLKGGCWIFLSHHSQDIEKIRIIRNEFERLGHNPLAFHLRCLNSDTEEGENEIDNLIKREIDAREWFVFCNNSNIFSEWVEMEQSYIVDSGKDKIWKIDMNDDIESILHKVRVICSDIEVFVSYAFRDKDMVKPLINALEEKDYSIWTPELKLKPNELWLNQIEDHIHNCTYKGFFIVVISENSVNSFYLKRELSFALSEGAVIVPIIIGKTKLPTDIESLLNSYQQIFIKEPTKKNFEEVLDIIEPVIKEKISRMNGL